MTMKLFFDGEIYRISRITGPKHNFLGISFGNTITEIEVEAVETKPDVSESRLCEKKIVESVLNGINRKNIELKTDYKVKKIQYIVSDTPPENIYGQLAEEMIDRIEKRQIIILKKSDV